MRTGGARTEKMKGTGRIRVKMRLKVVPHEGGNLTFDDIVGLGGINSWYCIPEMDNSIEVKMPGGSCTAEVVLELC